MDLARLRAGERIAAVSGIVLFVVMFFSWYGVDVGPISNALLDRAGVDTTLTAWQSFDVLDLFLLLTVLVAITLAALTASGRPVALPVATSVITTVLGGLATLAVAYRILNQPGPNDLVNVKFGAWLGLVACAGIAFGGWRSMQEEGSLDSTVAAARDAIPTRPAPPAEGGSAPPPSAPPPPAPSTPPGQEPPPPATP